MAAIRDRGTRVPTDPNISSELRRFLDDLARYQVRHNFEATAAPTVDDDATKNFSIGSRWIDLTGEDEYVCIDNTEGFAIWKQTTP